MKAEAATKTGLCDVSYRTDLSLQTVGLLGSDLQSRTQSSFFSERLFGLRESGLAGDQAMTDSVAHQTGDLVDIEPLHQAGAVRFDGLDTGAQLGGNLFA